MDLTVAICTYQRRDLLRVTLQSLMACVPTDRTWQLLVVDNDLDPDVAGLVEPFRHTGGWQGPARCVGEARVGTSNARNRATREAQAPVILFTDDDVTFDTEWLTRMARAIHEHNQCAFWGGRVEPKWPQPPPRWFDPRYCAMLGDTIVQYQRGDTPRLWDPQKDPPFYTANLAIRTAAIEEAGYFDTSVGHRGSVRCGMEDSLMVRAIADAGGQGWYAADALVHHPVPSERITRRYAQRFAWRQGWLSVELLRRQHQTDRDRGHVPRWVFAVALGQIAKGMGQWGRGLWHRHPAQRFAGRFTALFNLSKLWHAAKRPGPTETRCRAET